MSTLRTRAGHRDAPRATVDLDGRRAAVSFVDLVPLRRRDGTRELVDWSSSRLGGGPPA